MKLSEATTLQTLSLKAAGESNPTLLSGYSEPARVVVRNIGPANVFLATEAGNLSVSSSPTSGVFTLPTGFEVTIVVSDKQKLFAAGLGKTGRVSVAVSAASYGV